MWMYGHLWVWCSRKIASRYLFKSYQQHFLNMSISDTRCAKYESSFGNLTKCSKGEFNVPIYIVSRINGLSVAIKNLSQGHNIKELNVQTDSDILSSSSLKELGDANIVVIDPKLLAYNYKNMPKLKWAHCTWAGVEPLFEIMNEKPQFILTRHGEEDFSEQMAEYVMAQLLIIEKNFKSIWGAEIEKSWDKMQNCISDSLRNRLLKDLTLGILGVGNMGQAIANFFKPHGTRVIGLSRRKRRPDEFGVFDKIEVSLVEVLASSDYIVNTLPSTAETIGLLDGSVLEACTKIPVFINVGRGNIINESTLFKAFENKWLSHAVLDVFQEEPLPTSSRLWNSPNITITPHCAAISQPQHIAKDFLSSLLNFQHNSPLKNVVDWEKGY